MSAFNTNSIVVNKSYTFSINIINLYKQLSVDKEYVLSKQILRSGTSTGANANEAISAQSKADFVRILGISLREARETVYWLNLLKDTNFIPLEIFEKLNKECNELIKIISSIILTTKQKHLNS